MNFKIASNCSLPVEAVTQTFAVLAKRGSGKSYLSSVLAEEILKAGHQIIAFDPTGGWYGLRSSADGKQPGFPVVVFGGDHADVPLEESAGEIIAAALVESRQSAVIDVSLLRKGATMRFAVGFFETLYRLNREPVHLFIDEADGVAPQAGRYGGDEMRVLGAVEDIVRRGRKKGIGCSMITQRPASLNKNVLTQCESLFALRMTHPRDIDAIKEWVGVHAEPGEADQVIASLPTMPIGEAWLWSPGWLGALKRIKVRLRETFDSSATPKPGQVVRQPKQRAEIDLKKLGAQIQSTIDRAKADDPKALRKKITELEGQLARRAQAPQPKIERVDVPAISEKDAKAFLAAADKVSDASADLREAMKRIEGGIRMATDAKAFPYVGQGLLRRPGPQAIDKALPAEPRAKAAPPTIPPVAFATNGKLSGPEQRILDAIGWLEGIGVTPAEQTAVAFLAGYTAGGGAFNNPRGRLNKLGLVQYVNGMIRLTDEGRAVAMVPGTPLTAEDLQRHVLERLPGPEQRLLRPLLAAYPDSLSNEELAAASDYTAGAGAFNNPRGRLRSFGLIDYPSPGRVAAQPLLFPG